MMLPIFLLYLYPNIFKWIGIKPTDLSEIKRDGLAECEKHYTWTYKIVESTSVRGVLQDISSFWSGTVEIPEYAR